MKDNTKFNRASPAKPDLSQHSSIVPVAATTSTEGRPDISNSDIAESNARSRIIGLNTVKQTLAIAENTDDWENIQSRVSFSSIARTSTSTVQPVHELTGVVPDGHGEDHTAFKCFAHLCESATLLEG
jgi:hypothetical protein